MGRRHIRETLRVGAIGVVTRLTVCVTFCLTVCVLWGGGPTVARADYEETELRLKSVGVDEVLRARIHRSIDQAVAYLVTRQRENGSFRERRLFAGVQEAQTVSGLTALTGLALAHAGTPPAREAADRAIDHLLPGTDKIKRGVYREVYTAGVASMLLMARRRHHDVGREIARYLGDGQRAPSRWWSYVTYGEEIPPINSIGPNLSTTQFAALGLWAGERTDAAVPRHVWRRHLISLARTQHKSGSWGYGPDPNQAPYRAGTYMGLANVILSRAALGDSLADDERVAELGDQALERGLARLAIDASGTIAMIRGDAPGTFLPYYELYALEKACVFAGLERVGDVDWYVDGAEVLIDAQNRDGGWGSAVGTRRGTRIGGQARVASDLVSTSFALLFLLRSSEVYRPTTPRTPSLGRGPTTPGRTVVGESARETDDGPERPRPALISRVPLRDAQALLESLRAELRLRRPDSARLWAAVEAVSTSYSNLDVDPLPEGVEPTGDALIEQEVAFIAGAERWQLEAERLLIQALVATRTVGKSEDNVLEPAAIAAAAGLGRVRERAAARVRHAIATHLIEPDGHVSSGLYAAAFGALASLGRAQDATWLVEDVITADRQSHRIARTKGALAALSAFDHAPGRTRREAAERLVKVFGAVERSSGRYRGSVGPDEALRAYWKDIRPHVLRALIALCRDPATDRAPVSPGGTRIGTIAGYDDWIDAHESLRRAPWLD